MSDIEPSETTLTGRRQNPDKFAQDLSETPAGPSTSKGEREGLPSGYRMRADAHYVEQLTSRRADKIERDSLRGAPADVEVPSDPETRERRSDRMLAQLQEEIATIGSAAAMLTNDGSPLARRLSIDLIRAQAWRASWLVRAYGIVEGRERGPLRQKPLASLLEQVRQGLTPECRLAGVTLQVQATDWNANVPIDEPVLVAGITGGVIATLGLVGQTEGTVIRVHVDAAGTELRSVEISQDEVAAPQSAGLRFFDLSWAERPGGWSAGLAALAVRAAAQQHGGAAVLLVGERRGSTVRMNLARMH